MGVSDQSHERTVRRTVGEVTVIVVSILLAFSLDAWWQARQLDAEAGDLMHALQVEFEDAESELERVRLRHDQVVAAADDVLFQLRGEGSASAAVSAATLASLLLTPTTDPPRGTLDALLASGDLGLIRDEELRGRIADWPAALSDYQEEEQAARSFVLEELVPALGRHIDLRSTFEERLGSTIQRGSAAPTRAAPADSEVMTLPRGLELTNLIETRRYLSRFAQDNLPILRMSFDSLGAHLRREVE